MNSNGHTPSKQIIDLADYITVDEAADMSGYHPEYIRRLARRGKIGAEKKGRDWWIDRDVFKLYLQNPPPKGRPTESGHEAKA